MKTETQTIAVNVDVHITRDETGGYTVTCPKVPGVGFKASTRETAIELCQRAISMHGAQGNLRREFCLDKAEQADTAEDRVAWVALAAELRAGM